MMERQKGYTLADAYELFRRLSSGDPGTGATRGVREGGASRLAKRGREGLFRDGSP